jgi:hypothetical protein
MNVHHLILVPMGHREFKPVETNTSNNCETQLSSMVNEAGSRLSLDGR